MTTKAKFGASYRPRGYGISPALERARQPFRVRNAITGGLLFAFATSVWAYSISAVKQEDFDDVDAEAVKLGTRRADPSESSSESPTNASRPNLLKTVHPSPSSLPLSVPSALNQFRPTILDKFTQVRHPTEGNLLVWGAPPLSQIGSIWENRDVSW
ncbi:uncharacterized protein EI90DRAFT_3120921 [Cantharellus anzutake]|uniref:uncharacterized protein n=1 Tax=Cantharellus anzutake TaxID=1750568 RepID=UPI001908929F|nr:uncharacterized protein EI90DRAFT_3120921 [Cantharellus anzutake]KAF8335026.1 hypothetical protein EI90DRAFT_3120921 [Cantharellus anzutake]